MNLPPALTAPPSMLASDTAETSDARIAVLDHGFVELIDHLGSDLTVVNAARVSFGKRKTELDDKDEKLIKYLATHAHWSPFRHVQLQFHCKVPEFVARQWYKHVVGIAYSESGGAAPTVVDHAWNEISLRYVDASDFDFYIPQAFRRQSENNKQASTDETLDPALREGLATDQVRQHTAACAELYRTLVQSGVAREQARMVLPLNLYTEFYWTASLQAVANFLALRLHEGAQYEIRLYAEALAALTRRVAPVAMRALMPE